MRLARPTFRVSDHSFSSLFAQTLEEVLPIHLDDPLLPVFGFHPAQ